jgi:predicted RecB family endonuclease
LDYNYKDQYYSALEVAEIKRLTKQAVIDGCKRGQYPGAKKTDPTRGSKQGLWFIPKHVINEPVVTQDVVAVNRQITPQDLKNALKETLREEVQAIVREETAAAAEEIKQEIWRSAAQKTNEIEALGTRMERLHNHKSFWQRFF